jgi:hypothetical protein
MAVDIYFGTLLEELSDLEHNGHSATYLVVTIVVTILVRSLIVFSNFGLPFSEKKT